MGCTNHASGDFVPILYAYQSCNRVSGTAESLVGGVGARFDLYVYTDARRFRDDYLFWIVAPNVAFNGCRSFFSGAVSCQLSDL